jgi:TonB family protein
MQGLMLVGLTYAGTRVHQTIIRYQHYRSTQLVAYQPLLAEQPQPVTRPLVSRIRPMPENKPVLASTPTISPLVVKPGIKAVAMRRQVEPEPTPPEIKLESRKLTIPNAPTSPVVAVGTFTHESPVTAPVAKLADTVRSGGFGDPNAAVASGPHGAGEGSGSYGNAQVTGSGFGNGGIDALNASLRSKASLQPANEATTPVEITFKPKPDYTDEGRKLKINGEVRLQVMFKSDGRVVVVKVLQGLGYGLDEQAVKAAQQIKFRPAQREGQPVDSMAQIHIIFELIS